MTIILDEKSEKKLKKAAEHAGLSDVDALNRAIDVFLLASEMEDIKKLQEDMAYWESAYLETLALEDERIANLSND